MADNSSLIDWGGAVRTIPSLSGALRSMLVDLQESRQLPLTYLESASVDSRFETLVRGPRVDRPRSRWRAWGVKVRRSVGHVRGLSMPLSALERMLEGPSPTTPTATRTCASCSGPARRHGTRSGSDPREIESLEAIHGRSRTDEDRVPVPVLQYTPTWPEVRGHSRWRPASLLAVTRST